MTKQIDAHIKNLVKKLSAKSKPKPSPQTYDSTLAPEPDDQSLTARRLFNEMKRKD